MLYPPTHYFSYVIKVWPPTYIRSCHFTFNHCQTADSKTKRYSTPKSVVKIHLNRTTKVQFEKNDSQRAPLEYFRYLISDRQKFRL